MTEKELFDAIHQCKDEYLVEVIEEETNKKSKDRRLFSMKKQHISGIRAAVAALICILALGTGVTVIAATSDTFREWLMQAFGGHEVTEVDLNNDTDTKSNEPDIKADENEMISLKDNTQIFGEKESFVCEYHFEGDEEIVDKVYSIQGNGLKQLQTSSFQGEYNGTPFSFEYAVINQEICGFNYKGDLSEVFHYINGDIVYAALWDGDDTVEKGCIAALNLKTGEVTKLTDDNKLCNFLMSPNGKVILCNYRAEGYWTVFDIATGTEKRVKGINGYAHTKEIEFLDDYHILTLGESFMKGDVEWTSTYSIDLRTQKITEEYKDNGEINMGWSYTLENNCLKIYNITNKDFFTIENVKDDVYPINVKGNYVLFGEPEEEEAAFYLVNLMDKSFMEIDMPKELHFDVEMYLAAKEKKLLFMNGKEAYLVDVAKK